MGEIRIKLRDELKTVQLPLSAKGELLTVLLQTIVRARLDQTLSEKHLLGDHMNNLTSTSSLVDIQIAQAVEKVAQEAILELFMILFNKKL